MFTNMFDLKSVLHLSCNIIDLSNFQPCIVVGFTVFTMCQSFRKILQAKTSRNSRIQSCYFDSWRCIGLKSAKRVASLSVRSLFFRSSVRSVSEKIESGPPEARSFECLRNTTQLNRDTTIVALAQTNSSTLKSAFSAPAVINTSLKDLFRTQAKRSRNVVITV